MTQFDHIAFLVNSVENCVHFFKKLDLELGEVESFPEEGTKELYIGSSFGKILLLEAISKGPYKDALKKRGCGLHHVAYNTPNLEKFLESIENSGWHLHPRSLKTIKNSKTAWLCRAGTPALVEVHERNVGTGSNLVSGLALDFSGKEVTMFKSLDSNLDVSSSQSGKIKLDSQSVEIAHFINL